MAIRHLVDIDVQQIQDDGVVHPMIEGGHATAQTIEIIYAITAGEIAVRAVTNTARTPNKFFRIFHSFS